MDKIEEILTRGVANIISNKEELKTLLQSEKKLNIYLGIDPTSTKIHLGHAVNLRKLQKFAELGHHVTFLIGDFTAFIGDTSDKDTERPVLTPEEIEKNFQTYKKQAEKIVDFSKVHVRHNSEWLKKLNFEGILKLCRHFAVGDFVGRELVKKRLSENKRVGLHEFLYPAMQGYDSYYMDTDIQIGGTDQTFNMQAGRALQKDLRQKNSFVLTTVLLEGTDGRKMSKSWGNAIWLDDTPEDMYAKVMAITDDLIVQYFTLATNVPVEKVAEVKRLLENGEHPMKAKKELAHTIVSELHDEKKAQEAAEHFERTVQKDEMPTDIPTVKINLNENVKVSDVLVAANLAASKSDAKRLIEQGGVMVNNEKIADGNLSFGDLVKDDETLIQVGKRKFVKIKR